jgi:hypothetical protein
MLRTVLTKKASKPSNTRTNSDAEAKYDYRSDCSSGSNDDSNESDNGGGGGSGGDGDVMLRLADSPQLQDCRYWSHRATTRNVTNHHAKLLTPIQHQLLQHPATPSNTMYHHVTQPNTIIGTFCSRGSGYHT